METSTKPQAKHIGRKISRIRELRGIKQEALAVDLGISQQAISKIEQSETVDEDILERVSKVLGVEKEAIKNYNEDAVFNYFSNNSYNDNSSTNTNNNQCTFNPLDKLVEVMEENQ